MASYFMLAFGYFWARQPDEMLRWSREALAIDPSFSRAHMAMAGAYWQKGMYEAEIAELEKVRDAWGGSTGGIGRAYAELGRVDEARRVLKELQERAQREYVSPIWFADLYVGLGETRQAIQMLEQAYETRDASLVHIKVNPAWDLLRSDPGFKTLLRKMNLDG
jgi:tetratricopeptide (TPR) repeat protein